MRWGYDGHMSLEQHEFFMRLALGQAQRAWEAGEVPVGAVLVRGGGVLSTAHNAPVGLNDPTAHAEVLALRAAAQMVGNYRLPGSTMYVTLEPCAMCAMAMLHARVERIVYATADPKTGACGSMLNLLNLPLNHQTTAQAGVCADEASQLLRSFFKARRCTEGVV
jgi:tRNA(adenine34) deaminase